MVPSNVMTRNAGNGIMEVRWDAPLVFVAAHYDVYVSTSPTGTFEKANKKPILDTFCHVPNLPFGTTVYTKIKAVAADGSESDFSDLAVDAIVPRNVRALLRITGPIDCQIPANAVFSAPVNDELVGFKVLATHTL